MNISGLHILLIWGNNHTLYARYRINLGGRLLKYLLGFICFSDVYFFFCLLFVDALLADLQNTTTQSRHYQHSEGPGRQGDGVQQREPVQNHAQYSSTAVEYSSRYNQRSSGSETPPPLPPPPPQELLENIPPPKQFDQVRSTTWLLSWA